eukprot:TRINITY_DN22104_c0_g1_i1.p1 TRINITY_DN22104_c0_g1~~TRINITY_DN22104_c0_g1_i1.p1  ORF type:complete len:900 (+),score=156.83 TRINITY_DN22104_c0_g1_i1:37-2736(+)
MATLTAELWRSLPVCNDPLLSPPQSEPIAQHGHVPAPGQGSRCGTGASQAFWSRPPEPGPESARPPPEHPEASLDPVDELLARARGVAEQLLLGSTREGEAATHIGSLLHREADEVPCQPSEEEVAAELNEGLLSLLAAAQQRLLEEQAHLRQLNEEEELSSMDVGAQLAACRSAARSLGCLSVAPAEEEEAVLEEIVIGEFLGGLSPPDAALDSPSQMDCQAAQKDDFGCDVGSRQSSEPMSQASAGGSCAAGPDLPADVESAIESAVRTTSSIRHGRSGVSFSRREAKPPEQSFSSSRLQDAAASSTAPTRREDVTNQWAQEAALSPGRPKRPDDVPNQYVQAKPLDHFCGSTLAKTTAGAAGTSTSPARSTPRGEGEPTTMPLPRILEECRTRLPELDAAGRGNTLGNSAVAASSRSVEESLTRPPQLNAAERGSNAPEISEVVLSSRCLEENLTSLPELDATERGSNSCAACGQAAPEPAAQAPAVMDASMAAHDTACSEQPAVAASQAPGDANLAAAVGTTGGDAAPLQTTAGSMPAAVEPAAPAEPADNGAETAEVSPEHEPCSHEDAAAVPATVWRAASAEAANTTAESAAASSGCEPCSHACAAAAPAPAAGASERVPRCHDVAAAAVPVAAAGATHHSDELPVQSELLLRTLDFDEEFGLVESAAVGAVPRSALTLGWTLDGASQQQLCSANRAEVQVWQADGAFVAGHLKGCAGRQHMAAARELTTGRAFSYDFPPGSLRLEELAGCAADVAQLSIESGATSEAGSGQATSTCKLLRQRQTPLRVDPASSFALLAVDGLSALPDKLVGSPGANPVGSPAVALLLRARIVPADGNSGPWGAPLLVVVAPKDAEVVLDCLEESAGARVLPEAARAIQVKPWRKQPLIRSPA